MKKILCALMCALLMLAPALAEGEAEPEIVSLEEGSVSVASVGTSAETATPDETAGEPAPAASAAPAETAAPDTVRIGFEDGFALELPEGWQYHPTTQEMKDQGVAYCLSDADGAGWLYVQIWNTDCADINDLKALIDRTADIQTSGIYGFNDTDFVVYDLIESDVSCCASLLGGRVLNLVFTPQSDAGFMAVAAQILNTFERL